MSSMKRRVALAIGVSHAPPLPFLAGAVNGARQFHEWAQRLGYDSRLITDESESVTAPRLHAEFETLLSPDSPETHRFIVYFAGHGVIYAVEQGLWLLSDWHKQMRAVAVEILKRRLRWYRVNQVAIFADACRSLPDDIDIADLTADPILGRGPGPKLDTMAVDKFIAAQDGTQAFMIPGGDPDDDRCLFSGVALSALWGTQPDAFSKVAPGKVTSSSLGTYLQKEVPRLAKTYRLTLVPSVSPTFPEGDNIYYGDGPAVDPPTFPPWPPPGPLPTIGGGEVLLRPSLPMDPSRLGGRQGDGPTDALVNRMQEQDPPEAFETGSGFAVDGEAVIGIWTAGDVVAQPAGRRDWWHLRTRQQHSLERPAPALIHLANGLLVAVTGLPDFIGSVFVMENGAAALVFREVYAGREAARVTELAIGALERGPLHPNFLDIAAYLRIGKHMDPVQGVISAYLYDSLGDVESIRRMAYYYAAYGQPIPYDIALLGDLYAVRGTDNLLHTTVPAVPARQPRTERETQLHWTYEATPAAAGHIGGFWPLLRQGWNYLDDAPNSALVMPGLADMTPNLTPARFTTFHHSAGLHLAGMFGLTNRSSPR